MFLLNDPDRSTVARQDFFEPDLSVNPLSAAVRGVVSGLSLAPTVAQFALGDDEPLFEEMPSLVTMAERGLKGTIRPLVDNAAEAATLYRARQEDAMMQSGMASNLAYGVSYYLSGFLGGGLNPASYGLGLGKARMETEIRAGVDEDTAFTIGAIEGVTAGVGAAIPFLGKTAVQRFGFGVAANVVPGIAQRKAEQVTFGEVYAERAPDVFDPVALAVDSIMGGAFGYLSGLGAKPETIPVDAINDALDANINVRSGDAAPGFPNPKAFGIHMRMVKETIDAQNEGRAPDYTPLLDAEFADSPEMIRNFEESLADVTAGRMTEDRPIYDDILPQIEATGVYSAPEARANAKLASMAYTAMAKRMGMNPRDLMEQIPLKVITDAVDPVVNDVKERAKPSPADVAPAITKKVIVQNRNRASDASVIQMRRISSDPDYTRLGFSRDFANGAPVVAGGNISANQIGMVDVATASNGKRFNVRYAVVEADAVIASNAIDGTPVAEYYGEDFASTKAVAGNGRIAGIKQAHAQGSAENYKAELLNDNLHGISKDVIAAMEKPVLVRVMDVADITADIGDISNTSGISALSTVDQAKNDANRFELDALNFNEDGSPNESTLRQFIRSMPESERTGLTDENGQPTRQAVDRLNAAIFAKAYENDALIALYAQAVDPEARLVMSALASVAPKMARLSGMGGLDIREIVTQAAELAVNARRQGESLESFAKQRDIGVDDAVYVVLDLFAKNSRSNKEAIERLSEAADFAYKEGVKEGFDMFGEVPKATRQEIMEVVNGRYVTRDDASLEQQAGIGIDEGNVRPTEAQQGIEAGAIRNQASDQFSLESYTDADIQQRIEANEALAAQQDAETRAAYQKDAADAELNDFVLSGSRSDADLAAARGQESLFQESYVGQHTAPWRGDDVGAPLHDLSAVYPEDIYSAKAADYYGDSRGSAMDKKSAKILQSLRGKPDAEVTIYRAIPAGVDSKINAGDWVTVNRDYAKQHGESVLDGNYQIVEMKVKADDVFTNADSLHEQGYSPIGYDRDAVLNQEARGTYSPDTNTIGLTRAADSSTFVHELGHHLFEMLGKLASDPNAPTQIRADFETLVKHGGMKVDDWYASDINTRRAAHEKIADDFETYLMTGEAPSLELRNLFGMIRDWMLGVYKTIRGEVQPEVRAVFDRMLATDEQIAMKAQVVDYLAVQRQTEAKAKSSLDDNLMAAERAIDPDVEVVIDGTRIKASELLKAEEPQEATAMQKLKECLLNV